MKIKNLSPNALPLSDGTMLTQFESKDVKSLGEREKKYQERGWLQVETDVEVKPTESDDNKNGGKKK